MTKDRKVKQMFLIGIIILSIISVLVSMHNMTTYEEELFCSKTSEVNSCQLVSSETSFLGYQCDLDITRQECADESAVKLIKSPFFRDAECFENFDDGKGFYGYRCK